MALVKLQVAAAIATTEIQKSCTELKTLVAGCICSSLTLVVAELPFAVHSSQAIPAQRKDKALSQHSVAWSFPAKCNAGEETETTVARHAMPAPWVIARDQCILP